MSAMKPSNGEGGGRTQVRMPRRNQRTRRGVAASSAPRPSVYGRNTVMIAPASEMIMYLPRCAKRTLLGVNIFVWNSDDALETILLRLAHKSKTKVSFANSNSLLQIHRHNTGAQLLSDFIILNDGLAVDLASRFLYGSQFPENLNGTDFITKLLGAIPNGTRVFLLGTKPHIVAKAATEIERCFQVEICGYLDGYRSLADRERLLLRINGSNPDMLLVALGSPTQESWIVENANAISAPLLIGVGAWIDFFSKEFRRAPKWIRWFRLEWMYRLYQEPRRLWRRYSVDIILFFSLIFRERLYGRLTSLESIDNFAIVAAPISTDDSGVAERASEALDVPDRNA